VLFEGIQCQAEVVMATAADIIAQAKQDLHEPEARVWGSKDLLTFLNRALRVFDSWLLSIDSSRLFTTGNVTLLAGGTSVAAPSGAIQVHSVWDSTTQLSGPRDVIFLANYRQSTGTTGTPVSFGFDGVNIVFDVIADDDYTLTVHYSKLSTELTEASSMPFNDVFNDAILGGLLRIARGKVKDPKMRHDQIDEMLISEYSRSAHTRHMVSAKSTDGYELDF
jgi:hypothetical protein